MPIRLLLVEDDADIQEAMLDVLTEEGFSVSAASNGQEALSHLGASNDTPDVILLDLMMPVMDGRAFRERQLATSKLARIPIIVLSADRGAEAKAKDMRASACLTKPVDLPRLLTTIFGVVGAPGG